MSEKEFRAAVEVRLLPEVLDPQGATIEFGLRDLGFGTVSGVRAGKLIEFTIRAPSKDEAEAVVKQMAEKLLANPVIERFVVRVTQEDPRSP